MKAISAFKTLLGCLILIAWSVEAIACPLCHSGTGKEVRAGIFGGGDFLFNLFVVMAPFPMLALVVAWIYYGPPSFMRLARKRLQTSTTNGRQGHETERVRQYGDAS